jgi:hypothetical protein
VPLAHVAHVGLAHEAHVGLRDARLGEGRGAVALEAAVDRLEPGELVEQARDVGAGELEGGRAP